MIGNTLTILILNLFFLVGIANAEKARAYLQDGTNGTRSGPVRDVKGTVQLEKDRLHLVNHAMSNERKSGIAKPGEKNGQI